MAKEIFISYSRKDFDKVKAIKDEIDRELGIDCWMDLDGIESGDEFKKVIIKAINEHNTLLFMLSTNSMESPWALDELNFAKHKNKRIVLVYIERCEMNDDFYFDFHKYDTIDWDNPLQQNKLFNNLCLWFGKQRNQRHSPKQENTVPSHTIERLQERSLKVKKIISLLDAISHSKQTHQVQQNQNLPSTKGLSYSINERKLEATVTGIGFSQDLHIIIPQTILHNGKRYMVTGIGNAAFEFIESIKSVVIPDSVTKISENVFINCTDLEHIELGNSIKSIGTCAFWGCTKLKSIYLPNSVRTIGEAAFSRCSDLTTISIPNGVTNIEQHTFSECHNLTSVTIPNSVISIAREAFDQCKNLKSVIVPQNAKVDGYAFPGWCKVIRK